MKLVVVDDPILFREELVSLLARQPDMQVLGEAGTVAEAVDLARRLKPEMILMDFNLPDGTGVNPLSLLTARELEVLRELATGVSNRTIAGCLFISENTVRNHVQNLLEKLNLSSRGEAVSLARQNGLGKKQQWVLLKLSN